MTLFKRALLGAAMLLALVLPAIADQSSLCGPTTGTVSGLTVVNDFNAALQALATSNSGATAPANACAGVPQTGQWWLDSSGAQPVLKFYDGANWQVLGTVDAAAHAWTPPVGGGLGSLASAATTNLWSVPQAVVTVTGTTGISAFASGAATAGQLKAVIFQSGLTITHNGTSLILPNAQNLTVSAGDTIFVLALTSTNTKVVAYLPQTMLKSVTCGTGLTGGTITGSGTCALAAPPTTPVGTWMGTPSSANLRGALSDESGTGSAYFQGGDLGTPSAAVLTNATGTAPGLTAGAATGVKSATTTVDTSGGAAPSAGQVLTATDSTHATFQTPAGGGLTLLGTISTSSGTSATLTGLSLSGYLYVWCDVKSVSLTNAVALTIALGSGGGPSYGSPVTMTNPLSVSSSSFSGWLQISGITATNQSQAVFAALIYSGGPQAFFLAVPTGTAAAMTAIKLAPASGSFDAGQVPCYGAR